MSCLFSINRFFSALCRRYNGEPKTLTDEDKHQLLLMKESVEYYARRKAHLEEINLYALVMKYRKNFFAFLRKVLETSGLVNPNNEDEDLLHGIYLNEDGQVFTKMHLIKQRFCPLLIKILFNNKKQIGSTIFWDEHHLISFYTEQSTRRSKYEVSLFKSTVGAPKSKKSKSDHDDLDQGHVSNGEEFNGEEIEDHDNLGKLTLSFYE
jgi:hypothetical protein